MADQNQNSLANGAEDNVVTVAEPALSGVTPTPAEVSSDPLVSEANPDSFATVPNLVTESPDTITPAATEVLSVGTAESAVVGAEIQQVSPPVSDDTQSSNSGTSSVAIDASDPETPEQVASGGGDEQFPFEESKSFPGEEQYVREINKVIREDAEKPYDEEEDSELIQKDYMAKKFGVRIGKDKV